MNVSIKIILTGLLSTISIIIRIYNEFLVFFKINYISAVDRASPIVKEFFWFSRNDLLMSSLNDLILKLLWYFSIRYLPIRISFIFSDVG